LEDAQRHRPARRAETTLALPSRGTLGGQSALGEPRQCVEGVPGDELRARSLHCAWSWDASSADRSRRRLPGQSGEPGLATARPQPRL